MKRLAPYPRDEHVRVAGVESSSPRSVARPVRTGGSRRRSTPATRTSLKSQRRRAGVVALEEILTLAVMIPLAFAILFMAWRMSAVMFQVIRAFVLSPVL